MRGGVCGGAWRYMEGYAEVHGGVRGGVRRYAEGCAEVCRGVHGGAQRGVQRCAEVVAPSNHTFSGVIIGNLKFEAYFEVLYPL